MNSGKPLSHSGPPPAPAPAWMTKEHLLDLQLIPFYLESAKGKASSQWLQRSASVPPPSGRPSKWTSLWSPTGRSGETGPSHMCSEGEQVTLSRALGRHQGL